MSRTRPMTPAEVHKYNTRDQPPTQGAVDLSYAREPIGIFAIDPGTTTGIAFTAKPIRPGLNPAEAFSQSKLAVQQIDCTHEIAGAAIIQNLWITVLDKWMSHKPALALSQCYLVIEDFILRPGKTHSSVRTGLSPVRVTSTLMGMLYGAPWEPAPENVVLQQPADAKGRWTNERLKRAGLWTVGMEHGRDATRHAALFYIRADEHRRKHQPKAASLRKRPK